MKPLKTFTESYDKVIRDYGEPSPTKLKSFSSYKPGDFVEIYGGSGNRNMIGLILDIADVNSVALLDGNGTVVEFDKKPVIVRLSTYSAICGAIRKIKRGP